MFKEFKPRCRSIIFALNQTPFLDKAVVCMLVQNAQSSHQLAEMVGSYKGKQETSYQVDMRSLSSIEDFRDVLDAYEQESILVLDQNGFVFEALRRHNYYLDAFSVPIGKMILASTKPDGDYTMCKKTGNYFRVQPL